jgi:BirA family biotin operon repressor/biotin-[acetyl-CoA-carboxylase] ligase
LVLAARPAVENVVVFDGIDSTHAFALRLIDQAEDEELSLPPTLVIAGWQEAGVGRDARRWESPTGGLYLSWVAAGNEIPDLAVLPMAAAVAARQSIHSLGIERAAIKWPNDILVDGKKLAGILIHVRHGEVVWATVGVGINLTATPKIAAGALRPATSVADHLPVRNPRRWRERLVSVFVDELAAGVDQPGGVLEHWRENLVHRPGDEIEVRRGDGSEIRGTFIGVTNQGHLRLEIDGNQETITTGDVFG